MTTPTSNDVLLNLLKKVTGSDVTTDDYEATTPQVVSDGPTNSKVQFQAKVGSGKYAIQEFYYNRINLSELAAVRVVRGAAVNISDLIGQISDAAFLGSYVDTTPSPTATDYQLVKLTPTDIVDETLPARSGGAETTAYTLHAHMFSPLFIGQLEIELVEEPLPVPTVSAFTADPPWGMDGDAVKLSAKVRGLEPSTAHRLCFRFQENSEGSTYNGIIFFHDVVMTNNKGELEFLDYQTFERGLGFEGQLWFGVYLASGFELDQISDTTGSEAIVNSPLVQHDMLSEAIALRTVFFTRWNAGTPYGKVKPGCLTAEVDVFRTVRAMQGLSSGKWYWQIRSNNSRGMVGVQQFSEFFNYYLGSGPFGWGVGGNANQALFQNAIRTAFPNGWNKNHPIGLYLDMDAGTLGVMVGNTDLGIVFRGITGTVYPAASGCAKFGSDVTVNFGEEEMEGAIPGGYPPGVWSSEFNPTYLPGIKGWFDSRDLATVSVVDDKVIRWGDKSGAGNHATQSDTSKQYAFTIVGPDETAIQGTTGEQCMNFPDVLLPAKHCYVFAVIANLGETVALGKSAGGNQHFFKMTADSGGQVTVGRDAGTLTLTSVGDGATDGSNVVMSCYERPSVIGFRAGGGDMTSSTLHASVTINQLTGNGGLGEGLTGFIREVIFGDEPLTDALVAQVFNYLNTKWNPTI